MGKIKFKEDTHQYFSDKQELISVSKFTERFKNEVNWDQVAQRVATKLTKEGTPTTKAQILKKWEFKRNVSAQVGTLYHNLREEELLKQESVEFYSTKCTPQGCTYSDGMKNSIPIHDLENNKVYPELMIYDTEYMICGQSDKVIVTDNKIHIWDYKTDDRIEFKGYSTQWQKPKRFKTPLDHLEECNGTTYAIKMSLYMYLLWKANKGRFKPGEIVIEHIKLQRDPNKDNIPILDKDNKPIVLGSSQIVLPYLKDEVIAMLKTLKP